MVALAMCAAATSCEPAPLTELIVVVNSDLRVPSELDEVTIEVQGPLGAEESAGMMLSAPSDTPVTLTLVGDPSALEPVVVTATGLADGTEMLTQTLSSSFVARERRMLRIELLEACIAEQENCAPDQTCRRTDDGVNCLGTQAEPEPWRGTPPELDGGAVAPDLQPVEGLAVGGSHACVYDEAGHVFCWGSNGYNQLGRTGGLSSSPVYVSSIRAATALTAGAFHSCTVEGGGVSCWGANDFGQLGRGTLSPERSSSAVIVEGVSDVSTLAAGRLHTCALSLGTVWCWGGNAEGQLGRETSEDRSATAAPVEGLDTATVVDIAAGGDHTCAIAEGGDVYCWGANDSGQLGDGTTVGTSTAQPVPELGPVMYMALGNRHTCATSPTGQVSCFGGNASGQLGVGDDPASSTMPLALTGPTGATAITAGDAHTCAVAPCGDDSSGCVHCWGNNRGGQLGDGTTTSRSTSGEVVDIAGVDHVVAGTGLTCALSAGVASCWGTNSEGQLGRGTTGGGRAEPGAIQSP